MAAVRLNDYVFPSNKKGLSNMAMLAVLKRMDQADITVHGFRSTFRDWAAESTAYPGEVVEMALAHAIKNQTEAAYRRGDLMEKRGRLMEEWARYCKAPRLSGDVVPINKMARSDSV
jgi:integrase